MSSFTGPWGLLPLALALFLALRTREVIVALFAAIWLGATLLSGLNPITGLTRTLSDFIVGHSIADSSNAGVIVFCSLLGGLVNLTVALGGTAALADRILSRARGVRRTQLSGAILGLIIFFDDYASCMMVGSSMRPIARRQRFSLMKAAYITDATGAAVSSFAPVSSWMGMQLGLIAASWPGRSSIDVFLESMPFQFYSIFSIALVFIVVWMQRDFGPMLEAEIAARREPDTVEAHERGERPLQGTMVDFVLPAAAFVVLAFVSLWASGHEPAKSFVASISAGDTSKSLVWSATGATAVAAALGLRAKRMAPMRIVEVWMRGLQSILPSVIILILSFALKGVIEKLGLAAWVAASTHGWLSGPLLPVFAFVIAAGCAWTTGTSWGTDALIMPIVISVSLALTNGGDHSTVVAVAAVLTGSIFGDHCSLISDTTVLSATSTATSTFEHFRTQMPYGVLGLLVSVFAGFVPVSLGVHPALCIALGVAVMAAVVRVFGRPPAAATFEAIDAPAVGPAQGDGSVAK